MAAMNANASRITGIACSIPRMPPTPEGGVYPGPAVPLDVLLGTPKLQLVVATSPVNTVTTASFSQRPNLNGRKQICFVRSKAGEIASDAVIGGIWSFEGLEAHLSCNQLSSQSSMHLTMLKHYLLPCAFRSTNVMPDCTLSGTSACGHQSLKAASPRSHWMRCRTLFSRTRKRILSSSGGRRSNGMLAG